jgi:hypothetical protein
VEGESGSWFLVLGSWFLVVGEMEDEKWRIENGELKNGG